MSSRFGPVDSKALGAIVDCKLCGAPIVFRRHIRPNGDFGDLMPFDAGTVDHGEWVPVFGTQVRHVKDSRGDHSRFLVSHFGTCPPYLEEQRQAKEARAASEAAARASQPQQMGMF